ncbi:hypothetical protein FE697_017330 [Mumia zhuanghuii]|uniref:PknH-like extracellular domain-containing protein n=2 Tax=Mumia TaxID=1546255 RepID=A0ABW1QQR2_9ACTN|nr:MULTISPECIES: hypothetical protein [Mumia]KAA1420700.1 hypothetical protein FE697_017330 [Mumia zhuanghuii]
MNWRRSGSARALLPVLVLPVVLAGCGGGSSEATSTLTQDQLESVLVTLDDLPAGFVAVPASSAGGEDDSARASLNDAECLEGLDLGTDLQLDGADEAPTAEASFDRASVLTITSAATSYADDAVVAAFDETSEALASCSDFEVTADNGSGITGTLDSDDAAASDDVDAQINVRLTGTQQPTGLPVEITFGFARIGNDVVSVSAEGLGGPSAESFQDLMRASTDRLADVRKG